METIEIQVPSELGQRLRPYQHDLARLLELGLRYLEENKPTQPEIEPDDEQKQLMNALRQAGTIGPDISTTARYLAQPDNQNWRPIPAGGKPASQIIIEQRRGLNSD